jgi:hypothetical protein
VITPITITGNLGNPDGSLPSGGMMFQLSQLVNGIYVPTGIEDSGTGEIIVPQVVAGIVSQGKLLWNSPGGGGYNPLVLLANDDSTTLPVGTVYLVTEKLAVPMGGVQVGPWPLTVHHNATNGTLDISSQRPVP